MVDLFCSVVFRTSTARWLICFVVHFLGRVQRVGWFVLFGFPDKYRELVDLFCYLVFWTSTARWLIWFVCFLGWVPRVGWFVLFCYLVFRTSTARWLRSCWVIRTTALTNNAWWTPSTPWRHPPSNSSSTDKTKSHSCRTLSNSWSTYEDSCASSEVSVHGFISLRRCTDSSIHVHRFVYSWTRIRVCQSDEIFMANCQHGF